MKKISRRNFMIASGKAVGAMAVASAFAGCASPEQAENCFKPSGMPVKKDDRLTVIDATTWGRATSLVRPSLWRAVVRLSMKNPMDMQC